MQNNSLIRVSEYIANRLADYGIRHAFTVAGGGAMFLNDAFGHHARIKPVYNHHEQASAMAAEAYARISGLPGVAVVTTGPGGLNTLNGVFGAWTDSIPMLVLSGQVKRETCVASYDLPGLRQLGDQELDIVPMVRHISKYAAMIRDPGEVRYMLEKALYLATHGRPGPCWIDVPIDVQSSLVDPAQLRGFDPAELEQPPAADAASYATWIIEQLRKAKRPVIVAGSGIRAGAAMDEFTHLISTLGIPVLTAWTHDIIASDDPLFCGRPGTIGTRAGNFCAQNADLVLILGSRMNIRQTSYNWTSFAPRALKIQVDIDAAELNKPTFKPDHGICCDVKPLMGEMTKQLKAKHYDAAPYAEWLDWCRERRQRYPNVTAAQREYKGSINPYVFVEALFEQLDASDIVACGNATACIVPFQVAHLKAGQRMFSNSGSASMGYELPAAIGAWFGALDAGLKPRRLICLAGDGSLQMNVQELQTVTNYGIPLKIFVMNNQGYLSIRSSQNNFFGRLSGAGPESGSELPDYVKVASAYGLAASRLQAQDFIAPLQQMLDTPAAHVCDVVLDGAQGFEPRMSSRQLEDGRIVTPPLEDMHPFLSREELASNMLES
jgi:acetolactate synthase-1/2/3 large subunit